MTGFAIQVWLASTSESKFWDYKYVPSSWAHLNYIWLRKTIWKLERDKRMELLCRMLNVLAPGFKHLPVTTSSKMFHWSRKG